MYFLEFFFQMHFFGEMIQTLENMTTFPKLRFSNISIWQNQSEVLPMIELHII